MLPLLILLAAATGATKAQQSRDVATISAPGERGADDGLAELPDAELARRIERLRAENRRAFSDRRALDLKALLEEQERRRHEREWDATEKARRAEAEARTAEMEAAYQAEEAKRRDGAAAEQRLVATARARADRDAELAAEEQALEARQARTRWIGIGALGALALAGLGYALARARRGR